MWRGVGAAGERWSEGVRTLGGMFGGGCTREVPGGWLTSPHPQPTPQVDEFLTQRVEVESAECKVRHQAIVARVDTHQAETEGEFKTVRAGRESVTDEM